MAKARTESADFNHIREWLVPILDEMGISVDDLSRRADVTRASIYFWLADHTRPSEQAMAKICRVIGRPLEEALRQYTPRKNGRPYGSGGRMRTVTARSR